MVHLVADSYDKALYNSKVFHPLQTFEWGEARKETGLEVVRIEGDNTFFQMTIHPLPFSPYKIGYIPRSLWPSHEVLAFLSDLRKKYNLIFIKFEPDIPKTDFHVSDLAGQSHVRRSPHPLFPAWTMVLDTTKSESELLGAMKPKTRYNIRLAQKKGVVVKEMSSDEGFAIFSKLYFETCKRQHYFGHTLKYHQIVWNHLKQTQAHILIAFLNEKPLAAYELFFFGKKLYYPYGGSSEDERSVMAPNLLMWEAIRLSKRLGAQTFDMWGSLPKVYDPTDPWAGFTRFKEGYGAQFQEMAGSFDLVTQPLLYQGYNVADCVRKWYLRIR